MARQLTFRDLVEAACLDGRTKSEIKLEGRPRTMAWAAKKCGVSRQHLYSLFAGEKAAPLWTVHKIARGLGLPPAKVQKALDRSRALGVLA